MRIVRLPKFFKWVGFICGTVFTGFLIPVSVSYFIKGNATTRDLLFSYAVFGPLTILSLALAAASSFWRI
jgi:hypothetical protein